MLMAAMVAARSSAAHWVSIVSKPSVTQPVRYLSFDPTRPQVYSTGDETEICGQGICLVGGGDGAGTTLARE